MIDINEFEEILEKNLENRTQDYKRVFHGRGDFYGNFEFLTVDSIDKVLYAIYFEEVDEKLRENIEDVLKKVYKKHSFEALHIQKRYLDKGYSETILGELPNENFAYENGLKYKLNFFNKNIGFFPDMQNGREFVKNSSKDKKVLNLFSYTCSLGVVASAGEASLVVNVDMSKSALSTGRENFRQNSLDTKNVQFMPYNILKSWSRIKKYAPYDMIIIDPPSFQRGSFAATKDYEKIIKKLNQLASKDCIVLSALNAPELDTSFIKNLFLEHANEFKYIKRLDNLDTFVAKDEEKSLKNLIFKREIDKSKLCPLCQKENLCGVDKEGACWCMKTKIPNDLKLLIPEDKKMKACICQECVKKFTINSELFMKEYKPQK